MAYSPTITPETIRSLIKSELRFEDLPMNVSFEQLNLSSTDLKKIQIRLIKSLNKTVPSIFFIDTVYTIHEKLTSKRIANEL